MDQVTKLFMVMLLGSMLAGALIVAFNPRYRPERILKSNAHYFPDKVPNYGVITSTSTSEQTSPNISTSSHP